MELEQSVQLFAALADDSRLLILRRLLQEEQCVEELAQQLGLASSTVSFHLKKLAQAGLVRKNKRQYYTIFTPATETLSRSLAELLEFSDVARDQQESRLDRYRQKVLAAFFHNSRLNKLPAQYKKRRIILAEFADCFESGQEYPETQVNEIIGLRAEDYCTIRRLLVDEGFMTREAGVYRLVSGADRDEQLLPELD